ncbi:MAG: TraB/GumN family protein [Sphingomonadales bacterium]|nr:TraB/GumN family protein [Sphingomonadales bacterium]MBD3774768.1 TraB/GumN family protein [Paracoccaceae bacterium]
MARALSALAAALLLVSCGSPRQDDLPPPSPALWQVTGPDGQASGWLFGTIHALPDGVEWQTPALQQALDKAGLLLVEVADLDDRGAISGSFTRLSRTPGQAPLSARLAPVARAKLAAVLARAGMKEGDFADIESWGAALILAQSAAGDDAGKNGVDSALIAKFPRARIAELEGIEAQFGAFDRLPEKEQRDLLDLVVTDAEDTPADRRRMALAWRSGDMAAIEAEGSEGMLADPELRQALLIDRNRDWLGKIERALDAGRRPFVAVGGAHMAGPDGLPALLAADGYTVRRIQ